jgi:hypothetical protein
MSSGEAFRVEIQTLTAARLHAHLRARQAVRDRIAFRAIEFREVRTCLIADPNRPIFRGIHRGGVACARDAREDGKSKEVLHGCTCRT